MLVKDSLWETVIRRGSLNWVIMLPDGSIDCRIHEALLGFDILGIFICIWIPLNNTDVSFIKLQHLGMCKP